MSVDFDPYQEWLSIPPNERPANYYRLLGLLLFESNINVIGNAADRQMAFVRTFQTGQYAQQSQQILNELAQARITLLDKQKKAEYDAQLRAEQKSGSNGGIGVVSSLGSYGEVPSAPPPLATSLSPQPWNDSQGTNPGVQSHATPLGGNTTPSGGSSAPPPIPDIPNRSEVAFAFLKKHWAALLSVFFAVQLLICGTGLLAYLLKSSKTEVAQNAPVEPSQKADDGTEDATPSSEAELAKRYFEQSVELQEKENYDEALKKINVAVELQPDNKQYRAQQQALARFVKTLGKSKTPVTPVTPEDKPDSGGEAVPVPDNNDEPVLTQTNSESEAADENRPARTSMTPEEAKARLEAEAKAMFEAAEEESQPQKNTNSLVEIIHNEAVSLQKQGKYIQAAEKLNEAIELDPDNEQYKEEKSQFEKLAKAEKSYNETVELEQKEQYAEALVKIEEALAIDPNNEDFIKEKLNVQTGYYKQYVQHRIQREYPQALQKIDKAVALVPKEQFYKKEKQKTEELVKAVEEGKGLPEKDPDYGEPEEETEELVEDESDQLRGFEPGKIAGERKTVNVDGVTIAFRWCPPGTFIMGSPTSEANRKDDEKLHEVELTKGFWIMETQITVGMFKAFVVDTDYQSKGLTPWGLSNGKWQQDAGFSWLNPGFVQDDNSPVICISWRDAMAFSKWLGDKIESKTKLPTEAQWEYACRAGSKSAFFWGNVLKGDKANCNGNYPYGTIVKGPYLEKTAPVRSYQSNAWGVCDMHGNVWEWCLDGYAAYPNRKTTDPLERGDGSNRVFRGGSWSYFAERCRSAFRASDVPVIRLPNLGGRCVVEPSGDAPKAQSDFGAGEKAGDRIVKYINGEEFAFRWCPPGKFMMGSPDDEKGRETSEKQHEVTLTKGFWMMETEVTQKQWNAIMGYNWSKFKGSDLPVEEVSWDSCQEFCKICTLLGWPVQLPTEAQWEYACRAGSTEAYADELDEITWYNSNSGGKTHSVGALKPNAWGLYDMHGNVCEWCADRYGDYPSGSVTDPTGPSMGRNRVGRGGCWNFSSNKCRSASRAYSESDERFSDLGFRCIKGQGAGFGDASTQKDIFEDCQKNPFSGTWSRIAVKRITVTDPGENGTFVAICRNAGGTKDVRSNNRFRGGLQKKYSIECQLVQISEDGNKTTSKFKNATDDNPARCDFNLAPQTVTCFVRFRFVNKENPKKTFETAWGVVRNIELRGTNSISFELSPNDIDMLLKQ